MSKPSYIPILSYSHFEFVQLLQAALSLFIIFELKLNYQNKGKLYYQVQQIYYTLKHGFCVPEEWKRVSAIDGVSELNATIPANDSRSRSVQFILYTFTVVVIVFQIFHDGKQIETTHTMTISNTNWIVHRISGCVCMCLCVYVRGTRKFRWHMQIVKFNRKPIIEARILC